mgnify:FL=1|tara:strand:- start:4669 stop:5604 length:936 start_codon:yes stop_codon:yes gene_type:complete
MVEQQKPKSLDEELGIIPQEFIELDINHYSPTQLNQPMWLWALLYGAFSQQQRRRNKTNINMFFGTEIGSITQMMFCDEIWTYQSNKVENNKKLSMDQALETLNDYMNAYVPWDEKDQEKYEAIKHLAPDYLKQSYNGWKSLNFKSPVVAERNVTTEFTHINGLGRIDGEDELHFVEQKCKLPKLLKPKKDGTRSVSTQKIPDTPLISHCRQTAFYYACTKKRPFLLYVNDKEYKVFDSSNCDLLTVDAMQDHMEYYRQQARLRDRHILNSGGDPLRLLSLQDPDWDSFYADIGEENLNAAKDLFKQAHNL